MTRSYLAFACVACVVLLSGVQHARAATLTVVWDPSPDSTVTGYVVSYGTQPGRYSTSIVAGNTTSIALTGLNGATIYYVIAQAYDSQGVISAPTAEVVGQTALSPPSISCGAPVVMSFDGQPVSVTLLPVVTGGASPVGTQCSPRSGSRFAVGATPFTCTAVDTIQQTASCASTVTVVKSSAPTPRPEPEPAPPEHPERRPAHPEQPLELTLVCPAIPPVTIDRGDSAVVRFDTKVRGGTAPVTVSCSPASGSLFPVGTTAVSCRATDAMRQVASCTTSATVLTPSR